ncbi:MAG: hypothetical protein SO170_08365 [Butyribacter sp.]|nr:hypothetical protein [bacterium]MDY3854949.1 hypothetical protein [Butyribacter sp.]
MNKKTVDRIVEQLIQESLQQDRIYTKSEMIQRFCDKYSKDQMERICHRYFFCYGKRTQD